MSDKKKVLLVLNSINDYRVETYNLINDVFDFTIAYDQQDLTKSECHFKKIKLSSKHIGPFNVFGCNFWSECNKYDVVITSFDIHNFEFAFIPFIRRRYKLLTWGIGIRCSYTRPYDVNRKHQFLDKFAYKILQAADANIFYMEKAREFWKSTDLDQNKVFIAPNTTSIAPIIPCSRKNSILFVGTLYLSKGVDKLITAFNDALQGIDSDIRLDIVGNGDQREALEMLSKSYGLQNRIHFHGAIYNETELSKLFATALVCVSPTQAGLTVPKSMGYGVPIVTRRDAITGGEIYHITPNKTGIIYDYDDELTSIIKFAIQNPEVLCEMGNNAKIYYNQQARTFHQAQGVINAIRFALSHNE